MPNRPVRDQWECARKMDQHFPIKAGQPIGMALASLYSSSELPNQGKGAACEKYEISGPPPEVIPNISVRRNQNGLFHLNSDRNLPNLQHNGKHPQSPRTTKNHEASYILTQTFAVDLDFDRCTLGSLKRSSRAVEHMRASLNRL